MHLPIPSTALLAPAGRPSLMGRSLPVGTGPMKSAGAAADGACAPVRASSPWPRCARRRPRETPATPRCTNPATPLMPAGRRTLCGGAWTPALNGRCMSSLAPAAQPTESAGAADRACAAVHATSPAARGAPDARFPRKPRRAAHAVGARRWGGAFASAAKGRARVSDPLAPPPIEHALPVRAASPVAAARRVGPPLYEAVFRPCGFAAASAGDPSTLRDHGRAIPQKHRVERTRG